MGKRKYYIFALAALVLYVFAFLDQARKPALSPDFDADAVAYPAEVQGITVTGPESLRYVVEGWPPGDFVEIVPRDGAPRQVQLVHADSLSYRITAFASGIMFWLIATFTLAPRCNQRAARYFFWMILLYGLGIGLGGVYFNAHPWSARTVFGLMQFATLAFLPPIFMALAQTFPRELPIRRRMRPVMKILWALAAGIALWEFGTYQAYFLDPVPARWERLALPGRVADLLMILQALAGIALAAAQMRGLQTAAERQQAKWVLFGLIVGATPYVFIRNVSQLIGAEAPLPHHVDRIFELAIPVSFAMATARYRFMNIDIILRRGAFYGLLAGTMSVLVLAFGFALNRILPGASGTLEHAYLLLTGLLAGLIYPSVRRHIGAFVDRTFFRITYDRERALARWRHVADRIGDRESLVRSLADEVADDLETDLVGVIVGAGPDQRVAGSADPFLLRRWWEVCRDLPLGVGPMGCPHSTSLPDIERRNFPEALRNDGIVLVQPIFRDGACEGAIMCGPRPTGRRYVEDDLELLAGLADEAADTLARIALVRAVQEEGAERQRLDELNSLKNDFLAQVAHDLRTPLSSVTWSAANLRDGLAGPLSEGQERYVESIGSATAHLNRLVENLIEISQLDSGEVRFPVGPVLLCEVFADAVRTVSPVAEAKGVAIEPPRASGLEVMANADKLAVALVNLLDNALKYSPPGTTIETGIVSDADGTAVLTIRDHGPGFGDAADLCRRFAQGAPSPYSQQRGFGLGLYIVKSYLDRLGGRIDLADDPDGGAVVGCHLPLVGGGPRPVPETDSP